MKLQVQPNAWSCFPTAFAIIADVPIQQVFKTLGTDGSNIVFPELPAPINRRGFGVNEVIGFMVAMHWSVTPLGLAYEQCSRDYPNSMYTYRLSMPFIRGLMDEYDGVITGHLPSGYGHAVAWNHEERLAYNPRGSVEDLISSTLEMDIFYLCSRLTK